MSKMDNHVYCTHTAAANNRERHLWCDVVKVCLSVCLSVCVGVCGGARDRGWWQELSIQHPQLHATLLRPTIDNDGARWLASCWYMCILVSICSLTKGLLYFLSSSVGDESVKQWDTTEQLCNYQATSWTRSTIHAAFINTLDHNILSWFLFAKRIFDNFVTLVWPCWTFRLLHLFDSVINLLWFFCVSWQMNYEYKQFKIHSLWLQIQLNSYNKIYSANTEAMIITMITIEMYIIKSRQLTSVSIDK